MVEEVPNLEHQWLTFRNMEFRFNKEFYEPHAFDNMLSFDGASNDI